MPTDPSPSPPSAKPGPLAPGPAGAPSARAPWKAPAIRPYGSLRHLVRAASGPRNDSGSSNATRRPIV